MRFAVSQRGRTFKAGPNWLCSNTNYIALGFVIEKVTRHSYASGTLAAHPRAAETQTNRTPSDPSASRRPDRPPEKTRTDVGVWWNLSPTPPTSRTSTPRFCRARCFPSGGTLRDQSILSRPHRASDGLGMFGTEVGLRPRVGALRLVFLAYQTYGGSKRGWSARCGGQPPGRRARFRWRHGCAFPRLQRPSEWS